MSGFNIKSNLSAWICTFFVQAVFSQLKRIPTLLVISKKNCIQIKIHSHVNCMDPFQSLIDTWNTKSLMCETWVTRQAILSFLYLYKWSNFTFCLFVKISNLKDLYWTSTRVKSQRLVGLGNKFLKQILKKIGLICQRKTVGLFQCDIITRNLFEMVQYATFFTMHWKCLPPCLHYNLNTESNSFSFSYIMLF